MQKINRNENVEKKDKKINSHKNSERIRGEK